MKTNRSSRRVFPAIADPIRRRILVLLAEEAMSVGALTEHFHVSRPAISRHLARLIEAGLVSQERIGRKRRYALRASPLKEVHDWVERFRPLWETGTTGR